MSVESTWRQKSQAVRFDTRPVISGRRVESSSQSTLDCVCPADGRTLYQLQSGSPADAGAAVESAREAFDRGAWSGYSPLARKSILSGFAAAIDTNAQELALLDCLEMGKPISAAIADVSACGHIFRYYAEYADKLFGSTAVTAPGLTQFSSRQPRGVVAAIVPWNYPLPNAALKVGPALAAGNCVVLKPSELSSSSALRLAEIALSCGVPPGAFNVVPGAGNTVGAALVAHPQVSFVAFTGSTQTGSALQRAAAQSGPKALQLECGGKSANMVFPDCADLDVVAEDVAQRIFTNQGQLCVAGTRLIVHRSIRTELVKRVMARAQALQIGDPLDPQTQFGPLASYPRMQSVLEHIRGGVKAGAVVALGGEQLAAASGGFFVGPTILEAVTPEMAVAQEDIFGPVLSVLSFDTLDEAVALANASRYGLSASVWTGSLATAHTVAARLRVGRVTVLAGAPNPAAFAFPMGAEPVGQSGFGAEGGREGIEIYTTLKAVEIHA
ncbi:MAG: aldehyde dehydrogenase family protein [Proteobacteria bacterium]|nr:aldehyde dehydrogenase family protein [Pseudomonadota bacterium]